MAQLLTTLSLDVLPTYFILHEYIDLHIDPACVVGLRVMQAVLIHLLRSHYIQQKDFGCHETADSFEIGTKSCVKLLCYDLLATFPIIKYVLKPHINRLLIIGHGDFKDTGDLKAVLVKEL